MHAFIYIHAWMHACIYIYTHVLAENHGDIVDINNLKRQDVRFLCWMHTACVSATKEAMFCSQFLTFLGIPSAYLLMNLFLLCLIESNSTHMPPIPKCTKERGEEQRDGLEPQRTWDEQQERHFSM